MSDNKELKEELEEGVLKAARKLPSLAGISSTFNARRNLELEYVFRFSQLVKNGMRPRVKRMRQRGQN